MLMEIGGDAEGPKPLAVTVLGMHRSGTSAFAGAAVRLGFALPRTPMEASFANPGGFFESDVIVQINHDLLWSAGCAWNVCLTFEPEQAAQKLAGYERHMLAGALRREFCLQRGFVLKDPRLCLTFPAWLPAVISIGAAPRVLVVVRHPAEVVQSLAARNGLHPRETAVHWLHHMLEAERATRGAGAVGGLL